MRGGVKKVFIFMIGIIIVYIYKDILSMFFIDIMSLLGFEIFIGWDWNY